MIGSESHPMSFKNLRHTFYTKTTKVSCVQRESNNESSSEKVFRLQSLLYIKNVIHFYSVIYTDEAKIAAISRILIYN